MSVVSTFLSTLEREVFPVSAFQTVDYSLIKWPHVARQHFSYKTFDLLTVEHNNSALSQWHTVVINTVTSIREQLLLIVSSKSSTYVYDSRKVPRVHKLLATEQAS